MAASPHFPTAPDLGVQFNAALGPPPEPPTRPAIDAENWPTIDEIEELSLPEPTLTPGGDLERDVHRQVRANQARHRADIQLLREAGRDAGRRLFPQGPPGLGERFAQQSRAPQLDEGPDR